jgi:methyl-accepting chemotaxis protein/CHASE3 domain sensor protein
VRRLNLLFRLDRLSIPQRVFGGMGIILLLLVALSINSWRTITNVHQNADYVNASVTETAAVTLFAAQVSETRALVTQYALSENDSDLRAAQHSLGLLPDEISSITKAYAWSQSDRTSVEKLQGLADRYRKSVIGTIEAINTRRAHATNLLEAATELNTTVAAIVETLAHDSANAGALDDAIRLMEAFHSSNASATRFLASRNPADSDTTRVDIQAMNRAFDALRTRGVDNRRVQRFLKAMAEPLQQYGKAVEGLIGATEQFARAGADRSAAAAALIEAADHLRLTATKAQIGTVGGMMSAVTSARHIVYIASALAIIVGLVLAFVIGRGIARPIQQITSVMRELAGGRIDVVIPYLGQKNEIGGMAEAVRVFRDNKINADRLTVESETERRNKEQRTKSLEELNGRFEATATALTVTLASAAASLKDSAEVMFATTERAGERSGNVKTAAQQASANIESVAHAAEELSSSIESISDNATSSSVLSTQTTESARATNHAVHALAEDTREIERVSSLIKAIAQQTNLLALNATIEAARAGQAGRGFAVVANEVKALAAQTGRATEEIESQIARIQSVTTKVVTAIQDIVAKTGEMNEIATAVAAAVDQQRAATRTIAQSAQLALSSAVEAVHAVGSVEEASTATKSEANQVLDAASRLSRQSDDLRVEFDRFIAGIRAA